MLQLKSAAQAEIDVKKSHFIGQLHPVFSRAEAKIILDQVRIQHPNAGHVCWVLLCEGDSGLDDDGEPSGTAAKPIYNVLTHKNVTNVLAIVVRYWGGVKLGAGGLTRAYGQAISDAFCNAELAEIEITDELIIEIEFADESPVRRFCEQNTISILQVTYNEHVTLQLSMLATQCEAMELELTNLLRGKINFVRQETQTN